jgi:hypothetical protein
MTIDKEKKKQYNQKYREKIKNNDNVSVITNDIDNNDQIDEIEETKEIQTKVKQVKEKKKQEKVIYVETSSEEESEQDVSLEDIKYYIDAEIKKKLTKAKKRNVFKVEEEKGTSLISSMGSQLGQALMLGGLPIVLAYAKKNFLSEPQQIVRIQPQNIQQPQQLNNIF